MRDEHGRELNWTKQTVRRLDHCPGAGPSGPDTPEWQTLGFKCGTTSIFKQIACKGVSTVCLQDAVIWLKGFYCEKSDILIPIKAFTAAGLLSRKTWNA